MGQTQSGELFTQALSGKKKKRSERFQAQGDLTYHCWLEDRGRRNRKSGGDLTILSEGPR